MRDDFPQEIIERRRVLQIVLKAALQKEAYKGKAFLSVDKLIINKKAYTVKPKSNLHELPNDLNPETICERKNEQTLAFFGQGSGFSNFHPAPYKVDNVHYLCTEQQIQGEKAKLFNDDVAESRIMAATSPYIMKSIGSRIRNFNKDTWAEKAPDVAYRSLLHKFSQNERLKNKLLSTGTLILAEATRERLWGTGVGLHETGCLDNQSWTGTGIMGTALMKVRDALKPK